MSNSANLMSTLAGMEDNVAQKVDECPLNEGGYVLFVYNWECERCTLYRVVECPLHRGFYWSEIYVETLWTFRIVRYSVGV